MLVNTLNPQPHVINTAMILAAGRGERMRPLTDKTPKPLLKVGGYCLIEWQIKGLVQAGVSHIVINHAWLGEQFSQVLGDGTRYGCRLDYSHETHALETAGGIAKALPLLRSNTPKSQTHEAPSPIIVVSGDIVTDYDYRQLPYDLGSHAAHLVLVDNPIYHLMGDMGLVNGLVVPKPLNPTLTLNHVNTPALPYSALSYLTYGNIGVFDLNIFERLLVPTHVSPVPQPKKLFPWLYEQGSLSGEYYGGVWHNVGTPAQLAALNTPVDK